MKYYPSMVDGKIVRLSVSQLSRFDHDEKGGCKTKWWYKYVGKVPDPPSGAQQFGIDGHKRLELYFKGEEVELFPTEVNALDYLPDPNEHDLNGQVPQSEVQLEKLTLLRIPFQGSMDLVHGRDIYDYKFQAQIRPFEKPNVQVWGYLEELRLRDDSGGRLGFHHIYIGKKAPFPVKKVSTFAEPREVERTWQGYGRVVKEMQDVAAEPDVNKVPKNVSACFAYGPCPYLSICNRGSKLEGDIMGFLDDLRDAQKGGPVVAIPEPVPVGVQTLKALPPDAPPPDATPTQEVPVISLPKTRGKRKKEPMPDTNEVPDSSPTYAAKAPTPHKLKGMRLGLTIGLPEYSSAHVFVELEGGSEEGMAEEAHAMITRRLEALIPSYTKALELKKGKS